MRRSSLIALALAFFSWWAVAPAPALALSPSRTYKQRPEKYNMRVNELTVKAADGVSLRAWHFPATSGKDAPLVLISHDGQGNMADHLREVSAFLDLGFSVVTYDYRGYGESAEFEIDPAIAIYPHFTSDLEGMIDHVRKTLAPSFNLYGFGIGAGLSLGVGWNRPEIRTVVADTPFLSMEDMEKRVSALTPPLTVPFAGYEKRFEPLYALDQEVTSRVWQGALVILGSADPLYKKEDMAALVAKRKKQISQQVIIIPNPDQKENFRADKAAYIAALKAFYAPLTLSGPIPPIEIPPDDL